MNVVYLREPEDICPSEFPEDPHHDCKETIDYLERDNEALKLFISGQEAENAELKDLVEKNHAALSMLWAWTRAEVEHFGAAEPDDNIIKEVEAALDAAKELKP